MPLDDVEDRILNPLEAQHTARESSVSGSRVKSMRPQE